MADSSELKRIYKEQDLERLIQEHCYDNKNVVLKSSLCLCIACGSICKSSEIKRWNDGSDAVCSNEDCGLTGVIIGDASGVDFDIFS
ncbi:TPA: hypothetical protein ACMD2S_004444 [Vibrio parahaemolyticus]